MWRERVSSLCASLSIISERKLTSFPSLYRTGIERKTVFRFLKFSLVLCWIGCDNNLMLIYFWHLQRSMMMASVHVAIHTHKCKAVMPEQVMFWKEIQPQLTVCIALFWLLSSVTILSLWLKISWQRQLWIGLYICVVNRKMPHL